MGNKGSKASSRLPIQQVVAGVLCMLSTIVQSFCFSAPSWATARTVLLSYSGLLTSRGFLARSGCLLSEHSARRNISLSGILCGPLAIEDSLHDATIASHFDELQQLSRSKPVSRCETATATLDERYCTHRSWKEFELRADVLLGVSPLRHRRCGGFVPRYLPALSMQTRDELWKWDIQFSHVYDLWLTNGPYEQWARKQLNNPTSMLNRHGAILANAIAGELGCRVLFRVHKVR
jgi:hypothetical protein